MSQINVYDLTFYYEDSYDTIFEQVSFQIDTDWKLGFIGRNGRGKTTFLNLLMGNYEYRGKITSSVTFDYFPFPIKDDEKDKNTIELVERIDSNYELWKICRELSLLQVDSEILYRTFSTLSNGEQTKVMLAVLFAKDNNFMLIDEPTNHLDTSSRGILKEYLKGKRGFILVSHDKWFLDSCIDHVLVINKTNIQIEQGNFSSWFENKKSQDQFELAENERLKKDVKRLTQASERTARWADQVEKTKIGFNPIKEDRNISSRAYIGEKSRRMQQQRKNLEHRQQLALDNKSKLLKNIETADSLKIIALKHHKEILVQAKDLAIYYDKKRITKDLSFQIKNGDRIFLHGKNGCGKSSLLKRLLGKDIDFTGSFEMASGLIISYVSQDTSFLNGTLQEFADSNKLNESLFLALLRKLDFERTQFDKSIKEFSEGQKKKVLIAKSLCEQAHLYIWDEPLNYIDIFSRIQIEQLIKEYQPTMLLVEHDKFFVEEIATGILEF
ncbi:MAG: ABC-F type ribosomal protection protein [Bacteroidales bacterium]|nr:ABC-F type ribosomal protection protein [Bacteroidales bacterium]